MLDALGLFSTFSTPWFSAIYLLLFISLVGCIIPRTKHHFDALRARPPKTPARLERLVGFTSARRRRRMPASRSTRPRRCCGGRATASSATATSVSAERGYLRETGNLVFHAALVGMLITVGIGGGFGYTGQRVIVQDEPFTNVLSGYDSINKGRFFSESALEPYSLRLDEFEGHYELDASTGQWHPTDYEAQVSTREPGGDWTPGTIKVNSPLTIGGTDVYLLGNGYAPVITVRDPDGTAVFSGTVPFLPLDGNLRSRGVVKVPDGLDQQLGLQGFFYPDPVLLDDGTYTSFSPTEHGESLVTLFVYAGDLGLDEGVGVNAYALDIDGMTQLAGGDADAARARADRGRDGRPARRPRHHRVRGAAPLHQRRHPPRPDAGLGAAVRGADPRRAAGEPVRAASPHVGEGGRMRARLEYAGLARGEDPTLEAAVADLARRHRSGARRARNLGWSA